MRNNKGITLVTLIITIIVMVILAGVVINLVAGENGIINRTKIAKAKMQYESAKEIIDLKLNEALTDCISNDEEYNLKNIVRRLCEQEDITVDKYYSKSVAILQNIDEESINSLEGIVVSVDKYNIYKFLVEEDGKADKVTITTDANRLEISDFQLLEEFESTYLNSVLDANANKKPLVTIDEVITTTSSIKVNISVLDLGEGTIKYYYKKSLNSDYILANEEATRDLEYTFVNLEQGINYDIKVEAKNKKTGKVERENVKTISLDELASGEIRFSNPVWTNGKASVTASTTVIGYTLQTSKDSNNWSSEVTIDDLENNETMYARLWDGTNGSSPASETIAVNITGVSLNKTSATISISSKLQLTAIVEPSNCECKNITWSTSNSNLATVSNTGLVTIKANSGIVTITATSDVDLNKKASCIITISNNYANYRPFEGYAGGTGTSSNPYQITNVEQMRYLSAKVNVDGETYEGKYFKLMNDIDMGATWNSSGTLTAGKAFVPIGHWNSSASDSVTFKGKFNGNNHIINNLYINDTTKFCQALFGVLGQNGLIEKLTVTGVVYGGNATSGICGCNLGTINECINRVNVTGTSWGVGGINAYFVSGEVKYCRNYGKIKYTGTTGDVGGIVGLISGSTSRLKVQNCYNSGTIESTSSQSGGIVGNATLGEVYYCYNKGNVTGTYFVGGIVGYGSGMTVSYVDNIGTIYATNKFTDGNSYVGGIVGNCDTNSGTNQISYAYNEGNVSGKYSLPGGICSGTWGASGKIISISNVYNSGNVSSDTTSTWGAILGGAQYVTLTNGYYKSNLSKYIGQNISNNSLSCTAQASITLPSGLQSLRNHFISYN